MNDKLTLRNLPCSIEEDSITGMVMYDKETAIVIVGATQKTLKTFRSFYARQPFKFIALGNNTRDLVRMMYDHLLDDYCYCSFSDPASVAQTQAYLEKCYRVSRLFVCDEVLNQFNLKQYNLLSTLAPQVEQFCDTHNANKLISSFETVSLEQLCMY